MSLRATLLLGLLGLAANAGDYTFATRDGVVTLKVDFLPAYTGTPLVFYSGEKEIPLSAEMGFARRPDRFVGAGALVSYSLRHKGRARKIGEVREKVVLLGQSEDLPPRSTFNKTVKFVNGAASDLQIFGYDESSMPEAERHAIREASKRSWRRFRQELYLGSEKEPFAVLEWVHTIGAIQVAAARP